MMSAPGRRSSQHRTAKARIGTGRSAYCPPRTTPAKGCRTLLICYAVVPPCPSPCAWVNIPPPHGQVEQRAIDAESAGWHLSGATTPLPSASVKVPSPPHLATQWRGLKRPVSCRFRRFRGASIEPRESTHIGPSVFVMGTALPAPKGPFTATAANGEVGWIPDIPVREQAFA